jgi:hypothetical protein
MILRISDLTDFDANAAHASTVSNAADEKGLRFRARMAEFHSSLIGWAVILGSSGGHVGEFEY